MLRALLSERFTLFEKGRRSHVQTPCEAVSKKISGQTDGKGQPPRRFEGAKTLHLQVFPSALGRTRTCGLLIRSQPWPISVGRHPPSYTAILQGFLSSI